MLRPWWDWELLEGVDAVSLWWHSEEYCAFDKEKQHKRRTHQKSGFTVPPAPSMRWKKSKWREVKRRNRLKGGRESEREGGGTIRIGQRECRSLNSSLTEGWRGLDGRGWRRTGLLLRREEGEQVYYNVKLTHPLRPTSVQQIKVL